MAGEQRLRVRKPKKFGARSGLLLWHSEALAGTREHRHQASWGVAAPTNTKIGRYRCPEVQENGLFSRENGVFAAPPWIRKPALRLFALEAPLPNGDLRPPEETPDA